MTDCTETHTQRGMNVLISDSGLSGPTESSLHLSMTELDCIIHERPPLKEHLRSHPLKTNETDAHNAASSSTFPSIFSHFFCLSIRADPELSQHNYSLMSPHPPLPFTFNIQLGNAHLFYFTLPSHQSPSLFPPYPSSQLLRLPVDSSININNLHL